MYTNLSRQPHQKQGTSDSQMCPFLIRVGSQQVTSFKLLTRLARNNCNIFWELTFIDYICNITFQSPNISTMNKQIFTAFFALVISAPWACGLNYLNLETMQVESGSLVPAPTRTVKNTTIDGEEGVMVTYDIKYVQIDSNQVSKGTSRIGIPGFGEMTLASGMKIPARLDPLFVGNGTEFEVKLVESTYKSVSFLPHFSPGIGTMSPQSNAISSNVFTPVDNAAFFTSQRYRGNDICYVKVTPVSFNRVKLARIATRMSYFVKTVQGIEKAATRDFSDMPHVDFDMLNNFVINELTDTFQIADETAKLKNQSYLVISHPDFSEAVDSFIGWKKKLGFNMITELRSNWTEISVMKFIKDKYAQTPDLCYILIIGDTSRIPSRVMQIDFNNEEMTYESDIVYGNVDGDEDWLTELPVGRLYVSPQEAKVVVNKIISYEKNPSKNQTFYSNILAASMFESNSGDTENYFSVLSMESIRSYMTGLFTENTGKHSFEDNRIRYNQDRFYYASQELDPKYDFYGDPLPTELLRPNYNWKPAFDCIVNAINEGRFLTLFNGNAKNIGWLNIPFNLLHLSMLTNKDLLTVIFSINDKGIKQFSNNAFINSLVNKPEGGAIAAVNTISDFIPYGFDVMLLSMIDAIWPKPGITTKFYQPYKPNRIPEVAIGNVMLSGIKTLIEYFGFYERDLRRYMGSIYHITGDPSIKIPTGIPANLGGRVKTKFENNQIEINTFPYSVVFSVTNKTFGTSNRYEGMILTLPASAADDYEIWVSGRNIVPSEVTVDTASKALKQSDIVITSVTPNPAYEKVIVKFSGNVTMGSKVQLVNLITSEIREFVVTEDCESFDINLAGMKASNYAVSLVINNQIADSKQLIIK